MKLQNLRQLATAILIFGISVTAHAQQSEVQTERNSLLEAALKRSEEPTSKSVFFINKTQSDIETVKNIPSKNVKSVKVLIGDNVKKKFREKGINQLVMVTTKD
ncbi:hypothetical protein SAMN05443633_101631 [Chryseobacterium arachidis]|uniref:Uncharacterized protein n=1 Tax=Chryseobacterium arachidis TaxID=1416778 RepID=A0A1M4UZ94_9FLAO|nr:hypothetical protein [Chryseobacterium arachidis]SHE61968.1 hypothetical protein SAMN05443633_101631 [Chryseobacterium arachidis]